MLKHLLTTLLICSPLFAAHAQSLSVEATVTNATCNANGRISASVTGGSGDYRYFLQGECGQTFPPQNEPDFNTLPPCRYELIVVDRVSEARDTAALIIATEGTVLRVLPQFEGCAAIITIAGGSPPYDVTYQIGEGPMVEITSEDGRVDAGILADDILTGRVGDQCGNSRPFALDGTDTRVEGYGFNHTDSTIAFNLNGSTGPYPVTISSDAGTFTDTSGIFPLSQVGCNLMVSVANGCGNEPLVGNQALNSQLMLRCVNFSEGTATVAVAPPGIMPYTFTAFADNMEVAVTSDTTITGIPPGTRNLIITGRDGCGQVITRVPTTTQLYLSVPEVARGCENDRLTVTIDRACEGPLALPISIDCPTCAEPGPYTQAAPLQETTIANGTEMGNYVLNIEDSCGEQITCRDTLVLGARSLCDSIKADLVQLFMCDNGIQSRRPVRDPSLRFSLFDADGGLIESDSRSGAFGNLPLGTYRVDLTGECLTTNIQVTLTEPRPINAFISIRPQIRQGTDGSECATWYSAEVSSLDGPYTLERVDGVGEPIEVTGNGRNCVTIPVPEPILWGDYRLTSQRTCGEKLFTLPNLIEDRIDSVETFSVCPGSSQTRINGVLRTHLDWFTYFSDLGFNIMEGATLFDNYIIDGRTYSTNTIYNLLPGEYTLYVAPRFSSPSCPIDSVRFTVVGYQPVELATGGNFICNNTGEAALTLSPRLGNSPYQVRQIDCANPGDVLARFMVPEGDSIRAPVEGAGTYCYVVEDACGITSDFQVEVRSLEGQVTIDYTCAPTVEVFTDTLGGAFAWTDAAGSVLSTSTRVTLPEDPQDRVVNLEVTFNDCVDRISVPLSGRLIAPRISLAEDARSITRCAGDSSVLLPTVDTFSTLTIEGADAGTGFTATEPGTYRITAINDLGCTAMDSIVITDVPLPEPIISTISQHCPGEKATLGVTRGTGETIRWQPGGSTLDTIQRFTGGEYSVTATNAAGCTGVDTFTYTPPGPLSFDVQTDSLSCFGTADGALITSGTGGTGDLRYIFRDDTLLVGTLINDIAAGSYNLTLTDANGCMLDTTVTIGQPDSAFLDLGPDQFAGFGQLVRIPITTNFQVISQIVSVPAVTDTALVPGPIEIRLPRTTLLSVTATNDRGCSAADEILVTVDRALPVYAPTGFSPNDDGMNDGFTLFGPDEEVAVIGVLRVFDRWGALVFEGENLPLGDVSAGWGGQLATGREVIGGVYVWSAVLTLFDGSAT